MKGGRYLQDMSIGRMLTLVGVLATGAALLHAGIAIVIWDTATFRRAIARRMEVMAEVLAYNGSSALVFHDQEAATQTLTALRASLHVMGAALYTKEGSLFASYVRPSAGLRFADRITPLVELSSHRFEDGRLRVARQVMLDGEVVGSLLIETDLGEVGERVRAYGLIVLLVSGVSFLVALFVATTLGKRISRPILHLAETARGVSRDKDYSRRASGEGGRGEVGQLTSTFNEMLAEIQKRDADLLQARGDLEERVQVRTAMLRTSEEEVRRLNESLERRAQELEVANKELAAFSYSVSHDLRSPLRSIDGFSLALIEDYGEKLDAEGRGHLQRVRAAAQRMAQLIDDMLTLARITRAEINRRRVDLSALAGDVCEEVRGRDPERSVALDVQEGLQAQGDSRLLRVALENLISNAWKFTRHTAGARIEFGAERSDGGPPVFYVRDNGAGFDMAYAGKLFGAFQRLHGAQEFEGTGIGLATVARVIHRHGGRVWAEAAVGKGAAFFFTLGDGEAEADERVPEGDGGAL
jgi:signal transduction histidine kinase